MIEIILHYCYNMVKLYKSKKTKPALINKLSFKFTKKGEKFMKKILKLAVVISIIFAMLSGNVAVIAAEVVEIKSENTTKEGTATEVNTNTTSEKQATTKATTEPEESKSESTTGEAEKSKNESTTGETAERKDENTTSGATEETSKESNDDTEKSTKNENTKKTIDTTKDGKEEAESQEESETNSSNNEIEAINATPDENGQSEIPERDPLDTLAGSLELKIDLRLPQQKLNANSVKVTLTKGNKVITSTEKATGEANEKQLFYVFNNLEAGKYSLSISGTGYQTFNATDIEIKPNTTTQLGFTNGYDATSVDPITGKSMGTGIIRLGDVDGSKDVTQADVDALLNRIEGKENIKGYNYNLNQDKDEKGNDIIDIVDLSYAVINSGKTYIGASPRYITNLNLEKIESETKKGSYYTGTTNPDGEADPTLATDIKEVLSNNDKHVTLQPEDPTLEISEENPIEIGIDIEENTAETEYINIAPSENANNNITSGIITVEGYDYKNNKAVEIPCEILNTTNKETKVGYKVIREVAEDPVIKTDANSIEYETITGKTAKIEADGSITIDFGSQIAVKRVVIKVTGTQGNKLADIAKVEFLNGMADKIPEPQLGVPDLRKQEIDDSVNEEGFTVRWNNVPNVTGYRVIVRAEINGEEVTEIHEVDGHEFEIKTFNGGKFIKDLMNQNKYNDFTKYYVSVYSINGEWQSKPCEEYEVQPRPTSKPQPVTGVKAKGGYKLVKVSWNADRRASDYFVYYRKVGEKEWKLASTTKEEDEIVIENGKIVSGKKKKVTKGITETSFTISNLESLQKYEIMVKGRNYLGMSDESEIATAETLDVQEVELPNYKRINKPVLDKNGEPTVGVLTQGIKAIWHTANGAYSMKDSKLDTSKDGTLIKEDNKYSAKGVADNSYSSYFESTDWDAGGFYDGNDKGIIVEFNKAHTMNYVTFSKVRWDSSIQYATLRYKDMKTQQNVRVRASLVAQRKDANGFNYVAIKLAKPVTTDRLVIGLGGGGSINVAEMAFYDYDTIEDDINALFADNMHLTLAKDMDISTEKGKELAYARVAEIEKRLNTPDEESGEINPEANTLKKELETARTLIEKGDLGKVTKINSTMSTWYDSPSGDNNKNIEFRGSLNAWQPLGVSARSGEEITVYVGNPYKSVGDSTRLQLIFTQWRAEVGSWQSTVINNLQVGANTITLPDLITTNREHGGSLYINYTGLKEDEPTRFIDREYAVRVSGGNEIPVLDLSTEEVPDKVNYGGATRVAISKEERQKRITKYIDEIEKMVNTMETRHNEECMHSTDKYNVQEYGDGSDCILTATEIVMDDMMYSVSSKQIWKGLEEKGYKTKQQKVEGLTKTLQAMEDMMELFYKQKGLSKEGTAGVEYKDTFPRSRQNIRCMRMTGTAFMYAGGLHIGIQWNEVKDLSKGVPFTVDADGKITSKDGNYFGWGIAHEIGHVINQQAYVHGEVTNNYFSILAQTDNTRNTVRFDYKDVYAKVTSGKVGKSQNVFTQLGLYWQLHLAYDLGGYNYKEYSTANEQLKNSIYARMDKYARDTSRAPKTTIPLTLVNGDSENNLMRLACAATEKNILEFFEKWGMVPNKETIEYANQFDKETRAIYYVNDESRNYVLEKGTPLKVDNSKLTAEISNAVNNRINGNKVEFTFNMETENKDAILGYEIVRSYMEKDNKISRTVAFVESGTNKYTDVVSTINNRTFTYKVVAYDKYLNKVAEKELNPVKVSHKGEINKDGWVVTTNAKSETDKTIENDPENKKVDTSDEAQIISGVSALADNNYDVFEASTDGEDVEIVIELPETKKLVGLKYFADEQITNYEIQVKKKESDEWQTVKSQKTETSVVASIGNFFANIFKSADEKYAGEETLYFTKVDENGKNEITNYDYDVTYVKFIIHDSKIAIKELDLIGQTGDNVEFNEQGSIGLNEADFTYDASKGYKIPKDAIVFTGKYKGNPAYNAVLLWYQEEGSEQWQIVDGYQVILADDPGEANLGEINDGNWVFVVEQKAMDKDGQYIEGEENPFYKKIKEGKGKVRAELYRVDNALTLEGERIVSDTLVTEIPQELGNITLTDNRTKK